MKCKNRFLPLIPGYPFRRAGVNGETNRKPNRAWQETCKKCFWVVAMGSLTDFTKKEAFFWPLTDWYGGGTETERSDLVLLLLLPCRVLCSDPSALPAHRLVPTHLQNRDEILIINFSLFHSAVFWASSCCFVPAVWNLDVCSPLTGSRTATDWDHPLTRSQSRIGLGMERSDALLSLQKCTDCRKTPPLCCAVVRTCSCTGPVEWDEGHAAERPI